MCPPLGSTSPRSHSFLSDAQEKLLLKPSTSVHDIKKANEAALQQAIHASLHHDDGLTAAQKFARETGNQELIEKANEAAVEEAITASQQSPKRMPKSVSRLIPEEEFTAQRGLVAKLKNWLAEHGFIVKPNSGDRNNCLLISMLQHVTRDYRPDSQAIHRAAEHYKLLVVAWSGGTEKPSSALFSDNDLADMIVEQINQDYFGERRDLYVQFHFLTPGHDGKPAERYVGTGQRIEGILDGCGHYEAFVKRPEIR